MGIQTRPSKSRAEELMRVALWAEDHLLSGCLLLDTETTGLHHPEPVEIALVNQDGVVVFNKRVRASKPIETGAFLVHGISDADLADAPTFPQIYEELEALVRHETVLVYNWQFDIPMLNRVCEQYGLAPLFLNRPKNCVMEAYAVFVGDLNTKYRNYTWQKLPAGDHSAAGDCQSALLVLKEMANYVSPSAK
jgi:DNA polymerase-3 subunit epsilon